MTLVNGSGSCQLVPTVAGNGQMVMAPYAGDANYMNATGSTSISVHGTSTTATLDIDANGAVDALTDGILVQRYLRGLTGNALINGALSIGATVVDPAAILSYLDSIRGQLDIDANGQVDPDTDAVLIVRYLFGLRGAALIAGVVAIDATRVLPADIEAYIAALVN